MIKNQILKIVTLALAVVFLFNAPAFAEQQFFWQDSNSRMVNTTIGDVPPGSFNGGFNGPIEPVPDDSLYVCRGDYQESVQPGKLWKSWCHIGWGGKEVLLDEFEIMVTRPGNMELDWSPSYTGAPKPKNIVQGGYSSAFAEGFGGYPLYICRTPYQGGVHPGKLWKDMCHLGWGGKEVYLKDYEILTLYAPLP